MTIFEYLVVIVTTYFLIFTSFKTLSDFLYAYMKKKSNMKIFEYKEKKDIDLYYENELYKIKERNNDFELWYHYI